MNLQERKKCCDDRQDVYRLGVRCSVSQEQLRHNFYDHRSDLWALGCLMYELCALRLVHHFAVDIICAE